MFGFDCDYKKIWSTGGESHGTVCSARGENRWEVRLTNNTAHFTDANCGTITGAHVAPSPSSTPHWGTSSMCQAEAAAGLAFGCSVTF